MNSIAQYLAQIRQAAIKSDIKMSGWKIYNLSIALFIVGLILESVFYFSSFVRFTFWMSILTVIAIGIVWLTITIINIWNDKFDRYRKTTLAKKNR